MKKGHKSAFIAIIGAMVIISIIFLCLVYLIRGPSYPGPFDIEMEYVGKNADGNLVVRIMDWHRRVYGLSNVKVYLENKSGLYNFSENGMTLSAARQNYQNPQYEGNISYYDKDNDGIVTIGDEILIKSVENGGVGDIRDSSIISLKLWDGVNEKGVITTIHL